MKTIFSFFATIFFAANAYSQSSAELTCRAQAKEIALQTYSSCITEARNNQVEEIRKNYQKELSDLKTKYDKELKKMTGGKKGKIQASAPKATSAPRPVKGIAKELPGKAPAPANDTTPVQTVTEGTKVVTVGSFEEPSGLEKESAEAEQVEMVEMPVE